MSIALPTHGVATFLGKQFFTHEKDVQTPAIPFARFAAQLCAARCKAPRLHKVSTPVSLRDPSAQGDNCVDRVRLNPLRVGFRSTFKAKRSGRPDKETANGL